MAATSNANTTSRPRVNPAFSTARAITSSAARVPGRSGANPPSSPSPVANPSLLSTDLSAW